MPVDFTKHKDFITISENEYGLVQFGARMNEGKGNSLLYGDGLVISVGKINKKRWFMNPEDVRKLIVWLQSKAAQME